MSDPAEVFVPTVAILVIFGMPLGYLIIHRVFSHQERLEMIRRGIVPPQVGRGAPYTMPSTNYGQDFEAMDYSTWQANRSLRKGITLTAVGAALFVGLSFIGHGEPGPSAARRPHPAVHRHRSNHRRTALRRAIRRHGPEPISAGSAAAAGPAAISISAAAAAVRRPPRRTAGSLRLASGSDDGVGKAAFAAGRAALKRKKPSAAAGGFCLCYRCNRGPFSLARDQGDCPSSRSSRPNQISVGRAVVNLVARSQRVG